MNIAEDVIYLVDAEIVRTPPRFMRTKTST
jgi:hypothetical protein